MLPKCKKFLALTLVLIAAAAVLMGLQARGTLATTWILAVYILASGVSSEKISQQILRASVDVFIKIWRSGLIQRKRYDYFCNSKT